MAPKDFANHSLDSVSAHRARDLLGDRDAQSADLRVGSRAHDKDEMLGVYPLAAFLHVQEIAAPAQSVRARE